MKVNLISIRTPEVGEQVVIHVNPYAHNVHATWLGTVSDGKSLAAAMRLMWDLAAERVNSQRQDAETQGNPSAALRLCVKGGGNNEQVPDLRSRQPAN